MARYRKIDPRIWNDSKFRGLSDNGKLVFFHLLTHPHMTALGAMRANIPGLAAEMEWPLKAYREAFGEAFSKGMLKADEKASFLWVPNFLKYNPPESPNVVKAWTSAVDMLPECPLFVELMHKAKAFAEAYGKGFGEAFGKAFGKTMPNQEQEQEQDIKNPLTPLEGGGSGGNEKPKDKTRRKKFKPPTVQDVAEYCRQRNNGINPEEFCAFYESKGWVVGKSPMKDWKASVRTWEQKRAQDAQSGVHQGPQEVPTMSEEEFQAMYGGQTP